MKKTTSIAILVALFLVAGAVFGSAAMLKGGQSGALETGRAALSAEKSASCGCGCNGNCGGGCGVEGCNCAAKEKAVDSGASCSGGCGGSCGGSCGASSCGCGKSAD